MKAIVCELCGSNDIIKQDGLFVCQHCGTKYTTEEAKKLLGVVKIDKTEEINKQSALQDEQVIETQKKKQKIEQARKDDNNDLIDYVLFCVKIGFVGGLILALPGGILLLLVLYFWYKQSKSKGKQK
ncbi:TFIIB-type zinc finger domain-containing protein [Phascolarctobacterium sp.]|uniref:TFIIB-type zinc finger domain-containing protein n=1 Tax=Phascolarctobacterium sp. TaxID=2049039 RepID=UPI00386C55AF